MQLQEAKISPVSYDSASKGQSDRVIIPTFVPSDNVKAIDVTDLEPTERIRMSELVADYKAYRDAATANLFNFETFVEHQTGQQIDVKWRTFKVSGLK